MSYTIYLSKDEESALNGFLNKVDAETELEAIIRQPEASTQVDTLKNQRNFSTLLKAIRGNKEWVEESVSTTLDINSAVNGMTHRLTLSGNDEIQHYCRTDNITSINKENCKLMVKSRIGSKELENLNCKVNMNREVQLEITDKILKKINDEKKYFRMKKRYTFRRNGIQLDLTIVRNAMRSGSMNFKDSQTLKSPENMEIELEFKEISDIETMLKSIVYIKSILERSPLPVILKDVHGSLRTKEEVVKRYHNIITKPFNTNIPELFSRDSWIGPQVVSLTRYNIEILKKNSSSYRVTPKTDGERTFGLITDKKLFWITSDWSVRDSGFRTPTNEYDGTIVDGEVVYKTKTGTYVYHYLLFDIYFYKNQDMRHLLLDGDDKSRLSLLKDVCATLYIDDLVHNLNLSVFVKQFSMVESETIEVILKQQTTSELYENDGLIFTMNTGIVESQKDGAFLKTGISNDKFLKWKPKHCNTIDFNVVFDREVGDTYKKVDLKVGKIPKYDIFDLIQNKYHDARKNVATIFQTSNYSKVKEFLHTGGVADNYLDDAVHTVLTSCSQTLLKYTICPDGKKRLLCENMDEIKDGSVVEMYYSMTVNEQGAVAEWVPRNVRFDKVIGNDHSVATKIWDSYFSEITEHDIVNFQDMSPVEEQVQEDVYYTNDKDRNTSAIKTLRDFHNQIVKRDLIKNTIDSCSQDKLKVLELAVGKGGDIFKWRHPKIDFLVGVDKSLDNVTNGRSGACVRYKNMIRESPKVYSAVFLQGDCGLNIRSAESTDIPDYKILTKHIFGVEASKTLPNSIYSKVAGGFDIISIQFALHYFFESEKTLDDFIRNITENLKEGGYFIGTCYEDTRVLTLLGAYNESVEKRNNENMLLWKIEKSSVFNSSDVFGRKINVFMESIGQSIPEYLVNFDILINKLKAHGIVLVAKTSFESYYDQKNKTITMSKELQELSFLNVAFTFRKDSKSLGGKTQKNINYIPIKRSLKQNIKM
jgi:hypothetical protein